MKYDNHFFLSMKDAGSAKRLAGRVVLASFFVDVHNSCWKVSEKRRYEKECKKAVRQLTKDAASVGTALQIETCSFQVSVPSMQDFRENAGKTADQAVRGAGFPALIDVFLRLRAVYRADEVAPVFILHTGGRSFAFPSARKNMMATEFAMLFQTDLTSRTIIHELLHIFGALDYYYPDYVRECAQRHLPGSIMCTGERIDDLTAYVIGWRNDISAGAAAFLEETSHIPGQTMQEALENEIKGERDKNKSIGRKSAEKREDKREGKREGKRAGSGSYSGAANKSEKRVLPSCIPGVVLSQESVEWGLYENGKYRHFISNDLSFASRQKEDYLPGFFRRLKEEMEKSMNRRVDSAVLALPLPSHKTVWALSNCAESAGLRLRILGVSKAAMMGLALRNIPHNGRAWTYGILLRDQNEIEVCLAQLEDDVTEILAVYRMTLLSYEKPTSDTLRMILESAFAGSVAVGNASLDCLYYDKELETIVHEMLLSVGLTGLPFEHELVLQGAAAQGAALAGEPVNMLFLDALSYDFSIEKNRDCIVSIHSTVPVRGVYEGYFRDITDQRGYISISSRGEGGSSIATPEMIRVPVYELWDGRDPSQKAEIDISVNSNLQTVVVVKNLTSKKTVKKTWKNLYD